MLKSILEEGGLVSVEIRILIKKHIKKLWVQPIILILLFISVPLLMAFQNCNGHFVNYWLIMKVISMMQSSV